MPRRSQADLQSVHPPPTIVVSSSLEKRQSLKVMNSSKLKSLSRNKTEIFSVSAIIIALKLASINPTFVICQN